MDVNGTKFHLLWSTQDWLGQSDPLAQVSVSGPDATPDLIWGASGGVSLRPQLLVLTPPSGRLHLGPADRRGAARDRYGNWYWIAADEQEIRIFAADGAQYQHFWAASDAPTTCASTKETGAFTPVSAPLPPNLRLRGLAVTEQHYLVVGVQEPAGLLLFDLHAPAQPIQRIWPAQVPFAPFDMAPAPGGGIWILDRDPTLARQPRLWTLDRYFRVIDTDQTTVEMNPPVLAGFQPLGSADPPRPGRRFADGIPLMTGSPALPVHAVAVEALPDGSVLILESDPMRNYSTLYRYRYATQIGAGVTLQHALADFLETPGDAGQSDSLQGHDIAFVPDASPSTPAETFSGTLYLASTNGEQSFAFQLTGTATDWTLTLQPRLFPMRLFSGKGLVAPRAIAGQSAALTPGAFVPTVYYDLQEQWMPLVAQPGARYRTTGTLETQSFDGSLPDCVWHRLFLDACIPPGCTVVVQSRAANTPDLLAIAPWFTEPAPYLRSNGPEIPYYTPYTAAQTASNGVGTWELLFQQARGRYLQLQLLVNGNGRATPQMAALRVYYPRFSYLERYLPALYQYDASSASFMDRYLANVEGFYTAIEDRIAQAQELFDVRVLPPQYLPWLAQWFGVALDAGWDEARQRLFLKHAIALFMQRGTLAGLIRSIRLATDQCPDDSLFTTDVTAYGSQSVGSGGNYTIRIVESFLTRSAPGVVFGDPTQPSAPAPLLPGSGWTPAQGGAPLNARYQAYLQVLYGTIEMLNAAWGSMFTGFDAILFSPIVPAGQQTSADWLRFTRDELGFTYADVGASDLATWQGFLARRYRQPARYNAAYNLTGAAAISSFQQIQLPAETAFPAVGIGLNDWIQFVSLVLPIQRNAYHFTVLVPVAIDENVSTYQPLLNKVYRIVNAGKPAHTAFDVKLYWALFRVGTARVGLDTQLGASSRFVALVLGDGDLAAAYLAPSYPLNVKNRILVGRGSISAEPAL